jgi:hypothetical protein
LGPRRGNHSRDVRARFFECRAGLQPPDSAVAEIAEARLRPVDLKRDKHRHGLGEKSKRLGHYADDFGRVPVHDHPPADDAGIASEARFPVAVHQDRGLGSARRIVFL